MKSILLFISLFLASLVNAAHIGTDYGAACDGITDDIASFDAAARDIASGQITRLEIEGDCSLSSPWFITGQRHYRNVVIDGGGATLNNTVVLNASGVSIKSLSVRNSPSHGFVFLRGQGASHDLLTAAENNGHGFYFGIDDGMFGRNSQVTNVLFSMLSAVDNAGDGFRWDGAAESNRSWLNANTFLHPVSRGNSGKSWNSIFGSGPNGESRISYNTIISAQFEVNGGIPDFGLSSALTFVGGHFVDKDVNGSSALMGRRSYSFGGRYVGSVTDKDDTVIISNTSSGSGRLHRIPHLE